MQIRYQSRHGITNVTIPQLLGNPIGTWVDGEEREIADDLVVDVRASVGGPVVKARAIDVVFLAGPDFRDVATGLNPDYVCLECGRETLDDVYPRTNASGEVVYEPYVDAAGEKLCARCYLASLPASHAAWTYHAVVGSPAHAEAQTEVRRRVALDTTLENAPVDDEPLADEDRRAIEEPVDRSKLIELQHEV